MSSLPLDQLPSACFDGGVPALLATCAPDGTPNLTWLSQVFYVDERTVALSCQFFRKTAENLTTDPHAQLQVTHPESAEQWRLELRFLRRETSGPTFDAIKRRIDGIASQTHMKDVLTLRSADLFEVSCIHAVEIRTPQPQASPPRARDPLLALARIAEGIATCSGLEALVQSGLDLVMRQLGLDTVSLYLAEESERSLYALASRGYPASGVGARVAYGEGIIGACARERMPIRVADIARELRYGRVVQEQIARVALEGERELALPGLPTAASIVSVPLILDGALFGVLCSESPRRLAYDDRDTLLLSTAGNMLAQAIARHRDEEPELEGAAASAPPTIQHSVKLRYYQADDSVFVDSDYLIKGLPGRILWLLFSLRESEARTSFTNRELRLHPLLKLPAYKDNLETRLLLLQRRLEDKGSPLRIIRSQRGRLELACACSLELEFVAAGSE